MHPAVTLSPVTLSEVEVAVTLSVVEVTKIEVQLLNPTRMINPSSHQTSSTGLMNPGIIKAIVFVCLIFVGWKGIAGTHTGHGIRFSDPYIYETSILYPGGIQDAVDAALANQTVVIPGGHRAKEGFTTAEAATGINIRLDYLQPACVWIEGVETGNVTLSPSTRLHIDIYGIGWCEQGVDAFDRLGLYGTIDLGGAELVISLAGNFEPQPGSRFDIIVSNFENGITGTFANNDIIKVHKYYFYIQYNNMVTLPGNSTGYAVSLTAVAPAFNIQIKNTQKQKN